MKIVHCLFAYAEFSEADIYEATEKTDLRCNDSPTRSHVKLTFVWAWRWKQVMKPWFGRIWFEFYSYPLMFSSNLIQMALFISFKKSFTKLLTLSWLLRMFHDGSWWFQPQHTLRMLPTLDRDPGTTVNCVIHILVSVCKYVCTCACRVCINGFPRLHESVHWISDQT